MNRISKRPGTRKTARYRKRKDELTSRIDRFEGDITQATGVVGRLEDKVEGLHQEVERVDAFDAKQGWRNAKVNAIEAKLGIGNLRPRGRSAVDDLLAYLADHHRARNVGFPKAWGAMRDSEWTLGADPGPNQHGAPGASMRRVPASPRC